eukprot:1799104-Lingulodinium_polyedra.AAC.1
MENTEQMRGQHGNHSATTESTETMRGQRKQNGDNPEPAWKRRSPCGPTRTHHEDIHHGDNMET